MASDLFKRGNIYEDSGGLLSDWKGIIDNGTRITATGTATNSTNTLYTVPTGKILFLMAISFTWHEATSDPADMHFDIGGTSIFRIWDNVNQPFGSGADSMTFTTPIKLIAGETIQVISGNTFEYCAGCMLGYEVNA